MLVLHSAEFSRVRSLQFTGGSGFERCQGRVGRILALAGHSSVRAHLAPSSAKMKCRANTMHSFRSLRGLLLVGRRFVPLDSFPEIRFTGDCITPIGTLGFVSSVASAFHPKSLSQ